MSKSVRSAKKSNKCLIPIILIMGFVPLIVHMYIYNTNLSQYNWYPDSGEMQVDLFLAWKMIAIIIIGVVMGSILLYRHFVKKEKLRFDNSFYLIFFYLMFAGMSALFSSHKYWVARGTFQLFEPVWVVFVYILLCYYVYHFVREEEQVITILKWSGIGILMLTLIGVFQYFGLNFLQSSVAKHLITDPGYWSQLDQLDFRQAQGAVYATLYNPNFLSFYYGLLIPLVVGMFFSTKNKVYRILLVVVEILFVLCLKGSGSVSGWIAITIGSLIVAAVLLSRKQKTMIIGCACGVTCIVGIVVVCILTPLGAKLSTMFLGTYHMEEQYLLREIETKDNAVILDIEGDKLSFAYGTNALNGQYDIVCRDASGTEVKKTRVDEENQIDQIDDLPYARVRPFTWNGMRGLSVSIYSANWNFVYDEDEGYFLLNSAGKLEKFEAPASVKLFRDDMLSGRGHIWNLTFPLLGKHIFIGSGANTFLFEYPQNDYIYRTQEIGLGTYDVKAHCWYLQQWVENGMIALLLLLGFLGWYVVQSVRIYRRVEFNDSLTWLGLGLFSGVINYLVVCVANDSNVCTAPLFWTMLGLGMAVNRMLIDKGDLFLKSSEQEPVQAKPSTEDTKKQSGRKCKSK